MNLIETPLVDCFIALMLFILWAWDLPQHSLLNRLALKLKWPIQRLGLFHSWRMFSPDPSIDNYRLQFKLRLADGSVVAVEPEYLRFPETQRQPVRYRWSKIKNSLLRAESVPLRASMCKYVAAEFLARFVAEAQRMDKRPVDAQIVRWRQRIVPLMAKETANCEPYRQRIIHTQPINMRLPVADTAERDIEPAQPSLCRE
ncbi:MAG TPA: hypothetical protein VFY40_01130 [Blastocatellia bacterium]|nr:hypothetical protein [Blastocatellia bacterium]